jgi:hypothetical protein
MHRALFTAASTARSRASLRDDLVSGAVRISPSAFNSIATVTVSVAGRSGLTDCKPGGSSSLWRTRANNAAIRGAVPVALQEMSLSRSSGNDTAKRSVTVLVLMTVLVAVSVRTDGVGAGESAGGGGGSAGGAGSAGVEGSGWGLLAQPVATAHVSPARQTTKFVLIAVTLSHLEPRPGALDRTVEAREEG